MKKSLVIFLLIVLVLSCSKSKETVNDFSIINLKWNQSYSSQTIEDVTKGLNWTLSNIGVSLKFSSSDYLQVSNSILELNIKALNFESNGREILLKLHESIYSSDEYILNNSVDIGRYVCLLIGAPNHYNELVGVPNSLQDILSKYQLLPDKGKINNSSISLVDRVIEYSLQENELQLLLSTEVDSATNSIYEFETIEKEFYGDPLLFARGYWGEFLKGPWKLQILNVNPEDFDERTLNAFSERDFGNVNTYQVPDDEERTQTQRDIAKGDGTNEPVIVEKKPDGKYELIEGWHRTMSILLLGDNGEDLKNWGKVKIRAFVRDLSKLPI